MQRLIDKGYHLGSRGDKFDWLSEGAHLGGHWWKGPYAHIPLDGSRKPDPKRFNIGALSNAATAAAPKTRNQYAALTAIKVATDTWYVIGDIA